MNDTYRVLPLTEIEKKFSDSFPNEYIKELQRDGSILYTESYVKWLESRKEINIDTLQNLIIEKITDELSRKVLDVNLLETLNRLLDNVSNIRKNND